MASSDYIQVYMPNYLIPCVGGLCEGFVEGTAGQATLPTPQNPVTYGVYSTAKAAWEANNGNHPGELPPAGVRVAVFFKLGNNPAGHVALSLEDGRVASTTKAGYQPTPFIHPNLNDLIQTYAKYNNGCTLLGWSEYIGKQRIVEGGTMPGNADPYTVEALSEGFLNKPANESVKKNVGRPVNDVIDTFRTYPEARERMDKANRYDADVEAAFESGYAKGVAEGGDSDYEVATVYIKKGEK